MYQVLDSYQRFNQKNNMIFRIYWDRSQAHLDALRVETQLSQIERGVDGFSLRDYSLANAASVVVTSLGTGINRPDSGLTAWRPLPAHTSFTFPEERPSPTDPSAITRDVKRVARFFGASLVGIARLDRRWVYSHHYLPERDESQPVEIDDGYQFAISMAIEMNHEMIAASPTALQHAETLMKYSQMAFLVSAIAQFIRELGYRAIPSLNDTALNIPIAVDAGLGQLGRLGLLITPQFGPRQRLCKVITDLPLEVDRPIDFGVTRFCATCRKCARECPAQAISHDQMTAEARSISNNPGVVKWPILPEKCREYWSKVGTDCGVCIRVCPFNKPGGWFHRVPRWIVKNTPVLNPALVKADDLTGYGRYLNPRRFWGSS